MNTSTAVRHEEVRRIGEGVNPFSEDAALPLDGSASSIIVDDGSVEHGFGI